jgi:chemotaxis protein MotA
MDKSSFAGVFIALGGILVGLMLEGGKILQIIQPTAALIVFGGTLGAVMLQFPLRVVIAACKRLGQLFFDNSKDPQTLINEIVSYAHKARKDGIVSLDSELEKIADPFLRKSLMLAVDGTEPQEIRKMMELELDNQAEHEEHIPRVFESAGGFCPTIGIIGAVLGLIQVMQLWMTLARWGAESQSLSWRRFTGWAARIYFFFRPQERSSCVYGRSRSAGR